MESNSQESAVTTTACGPAESVDSKTGRGGTVQASPPSPEALFAGRSLGELEGEEFNDTVLARENLLVRMKAVAKDSEVTMDDEALAEELRLEIECLVANRDVARLRSVCRRRVAEGLMLALTAAITCALKPLVGAEWIPAISVLRWGLIFGAVMMVFYAAALRLSQGSKWRRCGQRHSGVDES